MNDQNIVLRALFAARYAAFSDLCHHGYLTSFIVPPVRLSVTMTCLFVMNSE